MSQRPQQPLKTSSDRMQDWQNKCSKLYINPDVVEEWARVSAAMNTVGQSGKGRGGGEDAAVEMMALLEAELKTVHDVMGKKWRCVPLPLCFWCCHGL